MKAANICSSAIDLWVNVIISTVMSVSALMLLRRRLLKSLRIDPKCDPESNKKVNLKSSIPYFNFSSQTQFHNYALKCKYSSCIKMIGVLR